MARGEIKRAVLKVSGEIFKGALGNGFSQKSCQQLALGIKALVSQGIELGIVIGGGNIFRGRQGKELGLPSAPRDYIGMLATVMNGIVLREFLEKVGLKSSLMTNLECPKVAESYTWVSATESLSNGEIIIFSGGSGSPFFTTDTAAALKACELGAQVLLKATKVDGIYNKDPLAYPDAYKFQTLSFRDFIQERLEVMDMTAITLCQNQNIPVLVFQMELLLKEPHASLKEISHLGSWIE